MGIRLIAAWLGLVLSLSALPGHALGGSLVTLVPEGTPGAVREKDPFADLPYLRGTLPPRTVVAQAPQDRRTDPPTAPGRSETPPSAAGFSPSNWGSVAKFFEERVQLVRFNVEGLFNISEFQTGSKAGPQEGGRFSGVAAPAFRLTEDSAIVLVYNASYTRDLQVFREDEGPRARSEEQRHELIALYSKDYTKPFGINFINRLTLSPSFFQTYAFTRQTAAEKWGNGIPFGGLQKFEGLYDYWDRGAGFEVKLLHEGPEERKHSLTASGQAYLRHYRNFVSLARQLNPASEEPKFEKDYVGYLTRVVYEFQAPEGRSFRVGFSELYRVYTEDVARINPLLEPGVPGERRRDVTDTLDARVTYGIPWMKGLIVGLGGSWSNNWSNSGYNDTLSPLPAAGAFNEHYYDYWSFRVEPEIIYAREVDFRLLTLPIKGVLTLSLNYSYDRRAYRDRKAKDKDGGFRDGGVGDKDENEVDVTHAIAPRVTFQFHKNWALLFEAKRAITRSNFEDERVYRYNYDINSLGLGVQYRF
ncbi:MAG: hypothetical protein AABZ64_00675 [Nitrospinota bacterium]